MRLAMADPRLVDVVERLMRAAIGVTTRSLGEAGPAAELTLQQWRALVVVVVAGPGGISVGDVADAVGIALPGASRLTRRLEDRGLVATRTDPADRRVTRVTATDPGRAAWEEVVRRRRSEVSRVLDSLDVASGEGAVDFLDQLAAAFDRLS
jgi:DNA-binding MarR family transcriptional regulator